MGEVATEKNGRAASFTEEVLRGKLRDAEATIRRMETQVEALADSIHGDSGWEHNGGCEGEPDCFACIEADLRQIVGGGV